MAQALKCDICGRLFEFKKAGSSQIRLLGRPNDCYTVVLRVRYDACPDCMKATLQLFIDRGNKDAEKELEVLCQ